MFTYVYVLIIYVHVVKKFIYDALEPGAVTDVATVVLITGSSRVHVSLPSASPIAIAVVPPAHHPLLPHPSAPTDSATLSR